jgi:hypothetical protein
MENRGWQEVSVAPFGARWKLEKQQNEDQTAAHRAT